MPVVPHKRYPLADKDTSWSFTAADGDKLIEKGGWQLFKSVHTWFDDEDGNVPEKKSAYKLPHHKDIDGTVKTVWRGVTAAMAALLGARGGVDIPSGDRRGVYNHLSKHYREFDEEPPEFRRYSESELRSLLARWGYSDVEIETLMIGFVEDQPSLLDINDHTHNISVVHVDSYSWDSPEQSYAREFGKPTKSQLEKINELAKRPLSAEEVFVFTSKMVGDKLLEDRNIKIHKSLLNVFKKDADEGVALMIDHPWAGLFRPKPAYPYGRTFNARLKKGDIEGEEWALYSDKYIVRDREKDGISTNEIIADIEDGIFFDTSIGFIAETLECSICGNDIRNISECEHFPGGEYDGEVCYIIAKPPGVLMEESLVFDGAYPTAGVLSEVGNSLDRGQEEFSIVTDFKSISVGAPVFNVYSSRKSNILSFVRNDSMKGKFQKGVDLGVNGVKVRLLDSSGNVVKEINGSEDVILKDVIPEDMLKQDKSEFISKEKAVEVLGKEYEADDVLRFAKEGIKLREDLIEDTIKWGIRAQGNDFPADAWKQMLSEPSRTIEAIKEFRDGFKKQAEDSIPSGRVTDPKAGKDKVQQSEIPDEAYKA